MTTWKNRENKTIIKFAKQDKKSGELIYPDLANREKLDLPCGKCIGCRIDYSKSWAIRCMHEAQSYDKNCFLTLTFNDKHLNANNSLDKKLFVKFMKQLRETIRKGFYYQKQHEEIKKYPPQTNVRFFQCGEYGDQLQRPHHHVILFNFDFPDKYLVTVKDHIKIYRSPTLEKVWSYGYSSISDVNFASASYVARYATKKITGDKAPDHYNGRTPEYVTMSRKPGIGKEWFKKYGLSDVYNTDSVHQRHNNLTLRPPRYYDKLYDLENHEHLQQIKERRVQQAKIANENAPSLESRKEVLKQKLQRRTRSYEKNLSINL